MRELIRIILWSRTAKTEIVHDLLGRIYFAYVFEGKRLDNAYLRGLLSPMVERPTFPDMTRLLMAVVLLSRGKGGWAEIGFGVPRNWKQTKIDKKIAQDLFLQEKKEAIYG